MKIRSLALTLLLTTAAPAALAGPVSGSISCPELGTARQAGVCPTEEDLYFTFNGYCSADSRAYGNGAEVCTDYQLYRKLKNIVLWESADGAFQAYISCDLPGESFKSRTPTGIAVAKQGKMNRLTCSYGEGVAFTLRTHDECHIENAAACKADASACKASCR